MSVILMSSRVDRACNVTGFHREAMSLESIHSRLLFGTGVQSASPKEIQWGVLQL